MTKSEMIDDDAPPSLKRYYLHIFAWALLTVPLILALATTASGARGLSEDAGVIDYALLAGGLIALVLTLYLFWRWRPDFAFGEPNTARGKRVRWMVLPLALFGAVLATALMPSDGEGFGRNLLFSNGAVPLIPAAIVCACWLIGIPLFTLYGRRNADEHNLAIHDFSMLVGFQTFYVIAPVWWMGSRGGFLPEPNVMIIFLATLFAMFIAKTYRRFA